MKRDDLDALLFDHQHALLNGIEYHFVTLGEGPAVILCHGFPDLWRSWRHQMAALAEAGFLAIAPDLRGFGETSGPDDVEAYTAVDVLGDLVALLDHLAIATAAIVGHDWGATIAAAAAQIRPDRFTALVTLSVPVAPRGPASLPEMLKQHAPPDFYMLYFLEPGVAERELDGDPREFIRRIVYTNSGALPRERVPGMRLAENGRLTDGLELPPGEMPWFDDRELDAYAAAYAKRGFRGALNTYRSIDRTWHLLAAWDDRKIGVPTLYIGGTRDIVLGFPGMREAVENLQRIAPLVRPVVMIDGAGHFMQFETPDAVNTALLAFLKSID